MSTNHICFCARTAVTPAPPRAESWNNTERYGFNAVVSDQDLYDTYLPAFGAAVTQGAYAMCG